MLTRWTSLALAAHALLAGACSSRSAPSEAPAAPPRTPPIVASTSTASFGGEGFVLGPAQGFAGGGEDRLFAATLDRDGRLLVAGASRARSGATRALLARYLPGGALDVGFAGDGVVLGPADGAAETFSGEFGLDAWYAVRVDREGRLLVAGRAGHAGGRTKALLARYLADGTLDATFGDAAGAARSGFVIGMGDEYLDDEFAGVPPESAFPDERFHALTLDGEGRILTAGVTADLNRSWLAGSEACRSWLPRLLCKSGFYGSLIARWTPAGALDVSFHKVGYSIGDGKNGRWSTGEHDQYLDLVMGAKGPLCVGSADDQTRAVRQVLVAAYEGDGAADRSFNASGTPGHLLGPTAARAGGRRELAQGVALDDHGRLLVSGVSLDEGGGARGLLVRLLPDGSPDAAFGQGGALITERLERPGVDEAPTVRALPSAAGPIYALAHTTLLRFDEAGRPDSGFKLRGDTPARATYEELVLDPAGRVYLVGAAAGRAAAVRYRGDGCLDGDVPCP